MSMRWFCTQMRPIGWLDADLWRVHHDVSPLSHLSKGDSSRGNQVDQTVRKEFTWNRFRFNFQRSSATFRFYRGSSPCRSRSNHPQTNKLNWKRMWTKRIISWTSTPWTTAWVNCNEEFGCRVDWSLRHQSVAEVFVKLILVVRRSRQGNIVAKRNHCTRLKILRFSFEAARARVQLFNHSFVLTARLTEGNNNKNIACAVLTIARRIAVRRWWWCAFDTGCSKMNWKRQTVHSENELTEH